jgi:hypothetical protein
MRLLSPGGHSQTLAHATTAALGGCGVLNPAFSKLPVKKP